MRLATCTLDNSQVYVHHMVTKKHGGRMLHGWIIWEAPKVLVDAVFHAVWENPKGELLCISVHEGGEDTILFLPDSSSAFDGLLVPNIGISWPPNPKVDRLLEAEYDLNSFMRENQDPDTGEVRCLKDEIHKRQRKINLLRESI